MANGKLQIEYIPVSELMTKLHPRNPKTHDLGALIVSFKEHGFVSPGTLDSRTDLFLCGHGRTEALQAMIQQHMEAPDGIIDNGNGWECPVVVGYHSKSDAQALAYLAADNKLTELGGWNEPQLAELLQELANSDEIEIAASGFDSDDLDQLLQDLGNNHNAGESSEAQVHKAEELNQKWGVETGQLWGIGEHRLLCGDSTSKSYIDFVMDGIKADLGLTDPPYGIKMSKGFEGFGGFGTPIARRQYSDEWDSDRPDNKAFILLFEYSVKAIIFGGNFFSDMLPVGKHWIVWDKNNTMPTFGDCELAWTNIKRISVKKYLVEYNGLIGKEPDRFHPTQKPLKLFAAILVDYTDPSDIIYDPFLGSGTTMVAAHNTGRICYGIEISPGYCAVILERMTALGLEPTLLDHYENSHES